VGLCGSGSELSLDLLVNLNRWTNKIITHGLNTSGVWNLGVWAEHPIHNILVDRVHWRDAVWLDVENVEVTGVPVCDWRTASTGRAHSSYETDLCCLAEVFIDLCEIVPTTVIHPLSEQFDWWLGAVSLRLGHVEIVNKNNAMLAERRAVNTLPLLLHGAVNDALSLECGCLGWETQGDSHVLLILEVFFEFWENSDRFTSSGGANNQGMLFFREEVIHKPPDTDAVNCRNNNFCVRSAYLDLIGRHGFQPRGPCILIRNVRHVKQGSEIRAYFCGKLHGFLAWFIINVVFFLDVFSVYKLNQVSVILSSWAFVDLSSNTPDRSE